MLYAAVIGMDTSAAGDFLAAEIFAAISAVERRATSDRIGAAMAAEEKAQGRPWVGHRRRRDVARRIAKARAAGESIGTIADELNSAGVPTTRGGTQWRPGTVEGALRTWTEHEEVSA